MQNHAPLKETDYCVYGPSTKFRWSYAASKLIDEFTALAYHRTKKLPTLIVRFFNTVGPRQTGRYGMVIPRFVKQALEDEPITVYGNGTQTRTFTHVRDVVEALIRLIDTPAALGEVVNIGGVEEISILHLAERIKTKVGSLSEIRLVPYDTVYPRDFEDMQRRVPSTEKLKELIGYTPSTDLDTILDDVIAYHRR
jgi:UDP-glucose 4-epimerase